MPFRSNAGWGFETDPKKRAEFTKQMNDRRKAWLTAWDPVKQQEAWRVDHSNIGSGGTLATAAGPHAGSIDVRRIWDLHSAVYWHVRATALFGLLFAYLLWKFSREKSEHYERGLLVLGVLAVQMVIGEIQYRTHLPWGIVLVHVTLSGVLWVAMTAWVAGMFRPSRMA